MANEAPQSVASQILDQIARNNNVSTRLSLELPFGTETEWSSRLASLVLNSIADLSVSVPNMMAKQYVFDIVSRALQAQVCRALIAVYQWIVHLGPSLSEHLIKIYREKGETGLTDKFPEFADLVIHIICFAKDHKAKRELAAAQQNPPKHKRGKPGRPKRRKIGHNADEEEVDTEILVSGPSNLVPAEWAICQQIGSTRISIQRQPDSKSERLGSHTCRPLLVLSARGTISLPRLGTTRLNTDDALYAAKTLCTVWEVHLVLKPMGNVDRYINSKERKPRVREPWEAIRDRCIIRGAILHTISRVVGDGIFSAKGVKLFLQRPCQMFSSALDRDEALARSIEGDEELTMEALYDYVCGLLVLEPELSTVCDTMSGLVQRGLVSVGPGVSLTDEEWENPAKFFAGDYSLLLLATKSKGKKRKEVVDLRPTLETLLPLKPKFGIAAIIIREALSRKRGHNQTSATEVFQRMLDGNHPTTGMPTHFDPDQTNPIRADLTSFTLLKELLPLHQLTTKTGISSLLAYLGTGQGATTADFLDRVRRRGQPMWHFSSAAACIGLFAEAERINTTLKAADRIEYDNPRIYGQPNTWHGAPPKAKDPHTERYFELTFTQRFEPYFCDEIQDSWHAFLGPLADQDPGSFTASRKSLGEVLHWILESGLQGFGGRLGALQFANTIVLAGIADPPSPAFMAQWIGINKDYGAFAGLQLLGFNLDKDSSPAAVRAAFCCFYYWLEHYLTKDDKDAVDFGTIFVEQLLCKISRWKHRMFSMGKLDLVEMARKVFEVDWAPGANIGDHTKFPIPSCKSQSELYRLDKLDSDETDIN
ncbi:hypothetical protein K438DRAFT_1796076 [Mycena galopus ATCC 62051]|nr:hypothetical protein K438DRAFT_1796076 [Mycena galopus ATCC 62051]